MHEDEIFSAPSRKKCDKAARNASKKYCLPGKDKTALCNRLSIIVVSLVRRIKEDCDPQKQVAQKLHINLVARYFRSSATAIETSAQIAVITHLCALTALVLQ